MRDCVGMLVYRYKVSGVVSHQILIELHLIPPHTHSQVNPSSLDLDHAHIQITYVEPYFTSEELQEQRTKFERENEISRFVFETPFTPDGKAHGQVTRQCMRKTILTSTCSSH